MMADDSNYARWTPVWSPDGKRLAYVRAKTGVDGSQLVIWSAEGRTEQPLTPLSDVAQVESPIGLPTASNFCCRKEPAMDSHKFQRYRQSRFPILNRFREVIAAKDAHYLWQAHFSPDGQWVAFLDQSSHFTRFESTVYVTRATGGPWIRVTDGKFWVDKPRWAPDGKTIYFLSRQSGFYDVWGIRFDLAKGKTVGDSFRVTDFGSPTLMIPNDMGTVGILAYPGQAYASVNGGVRQYLGLERCGPIGGSPTPGRLSEAG